MKEHGLPPPMGYGPNKRDLQMSKSSVAFEGPSKELPLMATAGIEDSVSTGLMSRKKAWTRCSFIVLLRRLDAWDPVGMDR